MGTGIKWAGATIGVIVCMYALAWGFALAGKPLRIFEAGVSRQVVQESLPYVQSKQIALTEMKTQWERLQTVAVTYDDPQVVTQLRAQQRALIDQMKVEAALIPNNIPPAIEAFLMWK